MFSSAFYTHERSGTICFRVSIVLASGTLGDYVLFPWSFDCYYSVAYEVHKMHWKGLLGRTMLYICYIAYSMAVFRCLLFYGFGWNWVEISNDHPVGGRCGI
jgi:hypothetical protein